MLWQFCFINTNNVYNVINFNVTLKYFYCVPVHIFAKVLTKIKTKDIPVETLIIPCLQMEQERISR